MVWRGGFATDGKDRKSWFSAAKKTDQRGAREVPEIAYDHNHLTVPSERQRLPRLLCLDERRVGRQHVAQLAQHARACVGASPGHQYMASSPPTSALAGLGLPLKVSPCRSRRSVNKTQTSVRGWAKRT